MATSYNDISEDENGIIYPIKEKNCSTEQFSQLLVSKPTDWIEKIGLGVNLENFINSNPSNNELFFKIDEQIKNYNFGEVNYVITNKRIIF